MLQRRLASLLVLVAVVALAASGCGSTSAAVQVGDESISQSDFEASLDFAYENDGWRTWLFQSEVPKDRLRPEDAGPGVYTQQYAGAMATIHVQMLLAPTLVRESDLSVSDDARSAAAAELDGAIDGGLDAVPDALRDVYVDGWAALGVIMNEGDADAINDLALERSADVSVSSQYGSWDRDRFAVVAPAGPRAAPGTPDETEPSVPAGSELPSG